VIFIFQTVFKIIIKWDHTLKKNEELIIKNWSLLMLTSSMDQGFTLLRIKIYQHINGFLRPNPNQDLTKFLTIIIQSDNKKRIYHLLIIEITNSK